MGRLVEKSWMETYELRMSGDEGYRCVWAVISISEEGFLNIQSDCGNFNYRWVSFGSSFKEYLVEVMGKCKNRVGGSLYRRLRDPKCVSEVDVEKTVTSIQEYVIKTRRERELGEYEARNLYEELDSFKSNNDNMIVDLFYTKLFADLDDMENAWDDVFPDMAFYDLDIVEYAKDPEAWTFCEVVAPVFAEVLEKELRGNG